MPTEILMPALSPTMTEGKLATWLKQEGDAVAPGDVIAEIETDKATMEVEAVDEGTLGKILIAEGTEGVAVNTPIALLLEDGEDKAALDGYAAGGANGAEPAPAAEPSRAGPEGQGGAAGQAARRAGDGPADGAGAAGRARGPGRHRDGQADRPRGAARRHGRGDAPRRRTSS